VTQLRSASFTAPTGLAADAFPFTVPAVGDLLGRALTFGTPITFLVGENGSGKSTVLEALAAAIGSITAGSVSASGDRSLAHLAPLVDAIRLTWSKRTRRGFFLRSEDFFGYARRMHDLRAEFEAERSAIWADPDRSDSAKGFASMPYSRELADLQRRYGEGLDAVSHGEAFLTLFRDRLVPGGLFLLDEPEAPMSPMRQLALLALMTDAARDRDAQFIVATHSPILMAAPGATIYSFDGGAVRAVPYADLEHVRFTRDFLNAPEAFLRHL
jgi:predicted ATPase